VKAPMLAGPSRIQIFEVAVEGDAWRQVILSLLVSVRFPLDKTGAAMRPASAPRAPTVPIHV
jgi:hypothetical protein